MAYLGKDELKYTPADWNNVLNIESAAAVRTQALSHDLRQQSKTLWKSADTSTKWDEYRNTDRLGRRVIEIKDWKEMLELIQQRLETEIHMCEQTKDTLDTKIAQLFKNLSDVTKCLSTRESRKSIDYVKDRAENELKKYQKMTIDSRDLLQSKAQEVFARILKLKEARQRVVVDLQDKTIAMGIDLEQYHLQPDSVGVSFKPNCMRIPKGSITEEMWHNFSKSNWDLANLEISRGNQLRAIVHDAICQVENNLHTQNEAAKFALRNRAHELQMALDELEHQRENLENEIADLESELNKLENSLLEKIPMQKLVQTRLERRTLRPGMDLVYDKPQVGLMAENCQLDATYRALQQKQSELRGQLHNLYLQLNRIKDEIKLKNESLALDAECIKTLDDHLPEDCQEYPVNGEVKDRTVAPNTTGKNYDFIVG